MTYLKGAWLADGPCYVIRATGVGENIVRSGDVVADILSGQLVPPHGPLWLDQRKIDGLTRAQVKAIRKAGVTDIVAIDRRDIVQATNQRRG